MKHSDKIGKTFQVTSTPFKVVGIEPFSGDLIVQWLFNTETSILTKEFFEDWCREVKSK